MPNTVICGVLGCSHLSILVFFNSGTGITQRYSILIVTHLAAISYSCVEPSQVDDASLYLSLVSVEIWWLADRKSSEVQLNYINDVSLHAASTRDSWSNSRQKL